MRRIWLVMLFVFVVLGVSTGTADEAAADDWGSCDYGAGTGCKPDSRGHTWCFTNSTNNTPSWRNSIAWAMNKMDNQTVMTESQIGGCAPDGVVDVRWREFDMPPTTLGQSTCTDSGSWDPCNQGWAAADIDNHNEWADNNNRPGSDGTVEPGEVKVNMDMTACHELGHTIGMQHHNLGWYESHDGDCMRNPWLEAHLSESGWREFNDHHIDHVFVGVN